MYRPRKENSQSNFREGCSLIETRSNDWLKRLNTSKMSKVWDYSSGRAWYLVKSKVEYLKLGLRRGRKVNRDIGELEIEIIVNLKRKSR